jgi:hypothetical protein
MKLKEFSTSSTMVLNGLPTVTFSKVGLITFSRVAVHGTGLEAGDKLVFLQDEENPGDWYMKRSTTLAGTVLRPGPGGALCCNFVEVARKVLESTRESLAGYQLSTTPESRARFRVATRLENGMYAIITRNRL